MFCATAEEATTWFNKFNELKKTLSRNSVAGDTGVYFFFVRVCVLLLLVILSP